MEDKNNFNLRLEIAIDNAPPDNITRRFLDLAATIEAEQRNKK